MNQSVQWNIIRENIAQLLFTQARCFLLWSPWIALCSPLQWWVGDYGIFIHCDCEIPGCWLVTDDDLGFFHRELEIPTKTFMLRGASILGKEQDSYLKLCRFFHKLTCNSRCYYLDQPGYYEKKCLGFPNTADRWKCDKSPTGYSHVAFQQLWWKLTSSIASMSQLVDVSGRGFVVSTLWAVDNFDQFWGRVA